MMQGWGNWGMMNYGFGGLGWLGGLFVVLFWVGVVVLVWLAVIRLWQLIKKDSNKK